ncbi:UNVERIFIED_CONTAM: membrane associated rhomboid family serine protease [Acetivibrio alkalicellulosi]
MRLLDKLERKFGKFAIPNLMMFIVGANFLVFLLSFLQGDWMGDNIIFKLMLIPELVLEGEVWRLVSFIFIPPQARPLFIIFALLLIYTYGNGLEHEWGSFKFNAYYLVGILGTIIAAFITNIHGITPHYLNLSLLFGFARFYPNYQIRLFFILPIEIKYIAWLNWLFMIGTIIFFPPQFKAAAIVAVLNYFLFFGKEIATNSKTRGSSKIRKAIYNQGVKGKGYTNRCTVCGITEKDNPQMEFRYCSSCEGDYEYCMDHLKNHEHIKSSSQEQERKEQ